MFLTKAWEGLMKWLIFLLLSAFAVVTFAADVDTQESSLAFEQKPVAKQVSFFDSAQAKVEVSQLGNMSTTLELMFSSGLRLGIEDLEQAMTPREVEQSKELYHVRLYGTFGSPQVMSLVSDLKGRSLARVIVNP